MCEPTGPIVLQVHALGPYGRGQVVLRWQDEPRPVHRQLDQLVADTWAAQEEQARKQGRTLFNGSLVRRLRHSTDDGRLVIDVGPTDYANFLATNVLNPHRAKEFGWHLYSNPMGTSTALVTADGWILVGLRSQRVAIHRGYVHAFSGGLETRDLRGDGTLDPYDGMYRELDEELHVKPAEVDAMACLGLMCERSVRQPELIFDTRVRLTRQQLLDRLDHEAPDQEHADIVGSPFAPEAFADFVSSVRPIASVTLGGLLLAGRRHFGGDWYRRAVERSGVTVTGL